MKPDRLDALGCALIAATAWSWALADAQRHDGPSLGVAALVWAVTAAKGVGVARVFMELDDAPPLWRRLVLGWLAGVLGVIALLRLAG